MEEKAKCKSDFLRLLRGLMSAPPGTLGYSTYLDHLWVAKNKESGGEPCNNQSKDLKSLQADCGP
jgi:hypothetical protein